MRLCFTLILPALLVSSSLWSQSVTLSGEVRNEENALLEGVRVFEKENNSNGTVTSEFGRFFLTLPIGKTTTLVFEYFGSTTHEVMVTPAAGNNRELKVVIPASLTLPGMEVSSDGRETGMKPIETRLLVSLPSVSGNIEDFLRTTVANIASELSSSYSVRGGSFDENLVYVNDIQIYRPFLVRAGEQEGLSFPNADMVDRINFSAGGFAARYGDKMSSVLDIRYRKPNALGGSAMASLLGGSLQFEGISRDERWTHNSGVRYKSLTYVLNSLDTQGDYDPRFIDFQTYLTFSPKPYGPLEFAVLGNFSSNKYRFIPGTRQTDVGTINEALRLTPFFEGQEVTQFETWFGAFSTRYQPSEKTSLKFIASAFSTAESEHFDVLGAYSLDELERDLGSDSFGEVLGNRGVGASLSHGRNDLEATVFNFTHRGVAELRGDRHTIEWGAEAIAENIFDELSEWTVIDSAGFASTHPADSIGYQVPTLQPSQDIPFQDVVRGINDVASARFSAYLQDGYKWRSAGDHRYSLNAGIRANHWTFSQQTVISPRATFSVTPDWEQVRRNPATGRDTTIARNIVFTLATGVYYQPPFYREMRGFDGRVNPDIRAQRSIHFIAGADYIFYGWGRPFKWVSEVYYKKLDFLIPFELQNVRQRYFATNNARGYAYGADMMLNGEFIQGVQSWLRLSYLKTEEDLNDDFFYYYLNAAGDTIVPGFSIDQFAVDSIRQTPGFVPRPNDQRISFSMVFQDEMKRWPEYKVLVSFFYASGLPFGPPSRERYLDINRTRFYLRTDIGFSRDFITLRNKNTSWFTSNFESAQLALEIFNLLGVNNTINHQWVEDVSGRLYGIPTYLTGRRINLRFSLRF